MTKVTAMADYLPVPGYVAPVTSSPLEHLLLALKHEGLETQAAVLARQKIRYWDATPCAVRANFWPGSTASTKR